ncbi:RraA family protein [Ensifer sp. SSB1]|uniref:RraA family protein n=1 Tax=Ensifer sp. SSB1 TaxID=2795385 RepID=UPI001A432055|nr:RraA family protein [Ensifer sp. SSB1]MBK5567886.1 RraA family protein [Ensifer sp. SSB1]
MSEQAWPAGFRINPRANGASPAWVERFQGIPSSWISDSMGRSIGTMGLAAYHNRIDLIVAAPAVTVRVRPGDNLMLHKAMEIANPGDFIVVDGGGDLSQALIGGNMQTTAIRKGLAGFVIDGAIRDLVDWANGKMPIWARGFTHRGPSKEGPGEINVPVAVGGMVVNPGDLVVADCDGVLAVSPSDFEALWPHIEKQKEKEAKLRQANASETPDPERFNSILRAKGCPV